MEELNHRYEQKTQKEEIKSRETRKSQKTEQLGWTRSWGTIVLSRERTELNDVKKQEHAQINGWTSFLENKRNKMERIKKVGTRPAQGLNIVLGERTEQNGTERFKKSRNTPSPTKESNGRTKFMDETEKTECTEATQNTDGTLQRYCTICLWLNKRFVSFFWKNSTWSNPALNHSSPLADTPHTPSLLLHTDTSIPSTFKYRYKHSINL